MSVGISLSVCRGVCFCFPPQRLLLLFSLSFVPPRHAPFAARSFNHAPCPLTAQPRCTTHSPPPTPARPHPHPTPRPGPPSPLSASLPRRRAVRQPLPCPDLTSGPNLHAKVSAADQSEKLRYQCFHNNYLHSPFAKTYCLKCWLKKRLQPSLRHSSMPPTPLLPL